jgi:hypothetical protein
VERAHDDFFLNFLLSLRIVWMKIDYDRVILDEFEYVRVILNKI